MPAPQKKLDPLVRRYLKGDDVGPEVIKAAHGMDLYRPKGSRSIKTAKDRRWARARAVGVVVV
jgi:hypothetical protein